MNLWVGDGLLAQEPIIRGTGADIWCAFTIANKEPGARDAIHAEMLTTYIRCEAEGLEAQAVAMAQVGDKIWINGRLKEWRRERDGQKITSMVVRVGLLRVYPRKGKKNV